MNKKVILIADDHELIRKGLRQLLEQENGYQIVEADGGETARSILTSQQVDIALLDIEMPELTGFQLVASLNEQHISEARIVFLTMHKEERMFQKAMELGAFGYILKDNTSEELLKCVQTVAAGQHYISSELSGMLLSRLMKEQEAAKNVSDAALTAAEKAVLQQVAQMRTNREIADALHISIKTVQNHRFHICEKLNLQGPHALLRYAMEHFG